MGEGLLRVALLGFWVAPFLAVETGQLVELVGEATDDALGGFFGFGAYDGGHGDVGFVLEFPVGQGPFVVIADGAIDGLFWLCAAGDLAAGEGASFP